MLRTPGFPKKNPFHYVRRPKKHTNTCSHKPLSLSKKGCGDECWPGSPWNLASAIPIQNPWNAKLPQNYFIYFKRVVLEPMSSSLAGLLPRLWILARILLFFRSTNSKTLRWLYCSCLLVSAEEEKEKTKKSKKKKKKKQKKNTNKNSWKEKGGMGKEPKKERQRKKKSQKGKEAGKRRKQGGRTNQKKTERKTWKSIQMH